MVHAEPWWTGGAIRPVGCPCQTLRSCLGPDPRGPPGRRYSPGRRWAPILPSGGLDAAVCPATGRARPSRLTVPDPQPRGAPRSWPFPAAGRDIGDLFRTLTGRTHQIRVYFFDFGVAVAPTVTTRPPNSPCHTLRRHGCLRTVSNNQAYGRRTERTAQPFRDRQSSSTIRSSACKARPPIRMEAVRLLLIPHDGLEENVGGPRSGGTVGCTCARLENPTACERMRLCSRE